MSFSQEKGDAYMKNRYWLLPILMLIGTWPYTLIRELLPQNNTLLHALLTLLLFALTALLLNRICSRKTVLISATGLLMFCLVLAVLDFLLSMEIGSYQFALGLAYLWEALFFPYLSLISLDVPFLFYVFPALIPFAWAIFCKPSL